LCARENKIHTVRLTKTRFKHDVPKRMERIGTMNGTAGWVQFVTPQVGEREIEKGFDKRVFRVG